MAASRSQKKRQAILKAAKQAFQQDGVQNSSMDKIAAIAEVSKRTVYNHFSSKERLVMELLAEVWEQSMADIDLQYQTDQPLLAQLTALLKAEIDFICSIEHIELMRMAVSHFLYRPENLQQEVAKLALPETALEKWFKAAEQDQRLVNIDRKRVLQQLHSLIKGSGLWPQLFHLADPLDAEQRTELAQSTGELFLSHYQR